MFFSGALHFVRHCKTRGRPSCRRSSLINIVYNYTKSIDVIYEWAKFRAVLAPEMTSINGWVSSMMSAMSKVMSFIRLNVIVTSASFACWQTPSFFPEVVFCLRGLYLLVHSDSFLFRMQRSQSTSLPLNGSDKIICPFVIVDLTPSLRLVLSVCLSARRVSTLFASLLIWSRLIVVSRQVTEVHICFASCLSCYKITVYLLCNR